MTGLNNNNLVILSLLTIFFYSIYIKSFKKIKQTERKEGLESHKIKNGTITMGGIIFLTLPLFFTSYTPDTKIIILTVIGFALLGLIDDILIVKFKKNDGLSPLVKFIIEIIISTISFYLYLKNGNSVILNIFNLNINLKWVYGIFILFLLTASTNAWNLVDGIDGLCSGLSLIFGIGLMIIAYKKARFDVFYMLIIFHISIFIYWCLNLPKAFLFMGDVGSLGLGALYAMTSIILDCFNSYIFMSLLFIFETLSVIIQVTYFKKTKGKRFFKMTPFHHHLELCGLNELQIDILFYIIQILLVILALNFL